MCEAGLITDPSGSAMDEGQSHSWHGLARAATFDFFEPVAAGQTGRWAGGSGRGPDGTTAIEVVALIAGGEVSVETSSWPGARPASLRRRMIATDLLWHFVLADETELDLPLSIVIVGDDRVFNVDGSAVAFHGVRVEGDSRWIGVADHEGVALRITAVNTDDFAIRRCVEWESLPEPPPIPE
jgi:hypothetical protein